MNLNKCKNSFPGILTQYNKGRSIIKGPSKQPKDTNKRSHQRLQQLINIPRGQFFGENDIQVDLLRNKIKLEIKEEPTEINTMDAATNHQGSQGDVNGPRKNLRRDSTNSDISVGSTDLRIVEDEEEDVNVETFSDEDEKVEISDEDSERMIALKDKEINFLRNQVEDLKKAIKEQDGKITNLNKLVQKHETMFHRIVEVGEGTLSENLKHELKALYEGRSQSEAVTSGAGQARTERATGNDEDQLSDADMPSNSGTSGSSNNNKDSGDSVSKDCSKVKRNKAVTFGPISYEGETSQSRQFHQHEWERDWQHGGHRGKRRRDWYLHDNRTSPPPYKRQVNKDPFWVPPSAASPNRHFRARGQRNRGQRAQFNCRYNDLNVRGHFNNYYHQNNERFNVAKETIHQLNLNSNNGSGVRISNGNEEMDTQPENEMMDDEVFQCPHCPHKFGERKDMEKHCEALHKFYTCDICDKQYVIEESLRRHLQSEHDI